MAHVHQDIRGHLLNWERIGGIVRLPSSRLPVNKEQKRSRGIAGRRRICSHVRREVIGRSRCRRPLPSSCAMDSRRWCIWNILPLRRCLSSLTRFHHHFLGFLLFSRRDERQMSINKRTTRQGRLWRRWLFQLTGAEKKKQKNKNDLDEIEGTEKAVDVARFLNVNRRRINLWIFTRVQISSRVYGVWAWPVDGWPPWPLGISDFPRGDGIFVSRSTLNSFRSFHFFYSSSSR